jgi:hypothetical protein
LLNEFTKKGENLAAKVNPGAANDGRNKRDAAKIRQNCIAGLLAEYLWKDFLNRKKITVEETEMEAASTQIDLRVIANGKKIEVRSSFPRNGIEFVILPKNLIFLVFTLMIISQEKFRKTII